MSSRPPNHAKTVLEVRDALRRHPWRFVLPAFLVSALVLAGSLALPRKYSAQAVFDRRTDPVLLEIMTRGAGRTFQSPRQSLAEELAGQPAIDDLVSNLLQTKDGPAHVSRLEAPGLKAKLAKKIIISYDLAASDLDRVRVQFIDENPHLARAVVNGLVDNYISRTRAQLETRLRETVSFFRTEVEVNRKLIETLENKKLGFEIQHSDLLPDSPNSLQALQLTAQQELTDLRQRRESACLRLEALRKTLADTPENSPSVTTARNPELAALHTRLAELRYQLEQNTGVLKMTDRHPDIIALKQQIAATQEKVHNTQEEVVTQTQTSANPRRAELSLLITTALTEIESLDKQAQLRDEQLKRLNADSANLFPVRSDYRKLSREIEQAQRQLTFWEDNLRSVGMALTAESGKRGVQLDFIKPCETLRTPISPDMAQVLTAAILLGLMSGAISAFFAHRTDETYCDGETLATAMGLPLLGAVTEITSRPQRNLRRLRQVVLYPMAAAAMILVMALLTGLLYVHLEKPYVRHAQSRGAADARAAAQQVTAAAPEVKE